MMLAIVVSSCKQVTAEVEQAKANSKENTIAAPKQTTFAETQGGSNLGQSVHNFQGMNYLIINLSYYSVHVVNLTKDSLEVAKLRKELQ